MAEFVELRTEEMLPEVEQMERMLMFEKEELRTIAKKRKEFEYKIQRRTKNKEDYLRYIQYEMDLLKLIRLRREKMGYQQKKANIDFTIGNRVNKLFKQAIFRFQDDVRLWLSYIKFCKQVRFYSCVSRMLVRMLQVHSDKPQLWKLAAKWEFEESQSVENARQFLLRGLRAHPESRLLYAEAFRMELHYAAKKRAELEEAKKKQQEGDLAVAGTSTKDSNESSAESKSSGVTFHGDVVPDQVAEGRLAELIYESAMKKVDGVAFIIQLLDIAKEFSFTGKLQKKIVEDLLNKYPDEELTWDTMARRELEGLTYSDPHNSNQSPLEPLLGVTADNSSIPLSPEGANTMEVDDDNSELNEKKGKSNLTQRLRLCCEVYEAVVKKINTEKMWSLYLDTMLEANSDQAHLPCYKKKLLKHALQGAHNAGKLQEKYYLHWIEMLQTAGKSKKARDVLKSGTERIPTSAELWQLRLRFHLSRDEEIIAEEVFHSALENLGTDPESVLPLWKIQLQYCQTKSPAKTEALFEKGLNAAPNVATALRPLYLEWLCLSRGIRDARAAYDKLCLQPPLSLDLHTKMAALESMQTTAIMKQVRKCHENASSQFGKDNADVWMDYVKFEMKRGEPKNISNIYLRAVRQLEPIQADIFIHEFSLVKTCMAAPQTPDS
ncbi:U3 small nucleolar RNA-associated protein 6 homolog [Frankliniella occidentalis]|uniref:U3 small nucleolar RNA-associated protein 6 homolog n=1 Tax=Frankliniella occidentalis TaxID=133901 RepID=A0A6J1SA47_FRAOC|nr:U3 small nucleolar RNA-associated protein 6 homolog [Frankliniella occidentalis]